MAQAMRDGGFQQLQSHGIDIDIDFGYAKEALRTYAPRFESAYRFVFGKDYADMFTAEMNENYAYATEGRYKSMLKDAGFNVFYTERNPGDWSQENRTDGNIEIYTLENQGWKRNEKLPFDYQIVIGFERQADAPKSSRTWQPTVRSNQPLATIAEEDDAVATKPLRPSMTFAAPKAKVSDFTAWIANLARRTMKMVAPHANLNSTPRRLPDALRRRPRARCLLGSDDGLRHQRCPVPTA